MGRWARAARNPRASRSNPSCWPWSRATRHALAGQARSSSTVTVHSERPGPGAIRAFFVGSAGHADFGKAGNAAAVAGHEADHAGAVGQGDIAALGTDGAIGQRDEAIVHA